MKKFSIIVVAPLLVAVLGCVSAAHGQRVEVREAESDVVEGDAPASAKRPELERVEELIVARVNEFRGKQGLKKVEPNKSLAAAAKEFAQYMARTGRYGHTADGRQPSERARAHGYQYCIVSENIVYQYQSAGFETSELAEAFVQGWIDSPGHRKNMLDPDVVDSGVGVARGESGRYYAVQMFGRPESMQIKFTIANQTNTTVRYTVDGQSFQVPPRVTRTHERCRPPQLKFGAQGDQTLRPTDGARYVVEFAPDGGVKVQTTGQ